MTFNLEILHTLCNEENLSDSKILPCVSEDKELCAL